MSVRHKVDLKRPGAPETEQRGAPRADRRALNRGDRLHDSTLRSQRAMAVATIYPYAGEGREGEKGSK
jgi:hypothetical protein